MTKTILVGAILLGFFSLWLILWLHITAAMFVERAMAKKYFGNTTRLLFKTWGTSFLFWLQHGLHITWVQPKNKQIIASFQNPGKKCLSGRCMVKPHHWRAGLLQVNSWAKTEKVIPTKEQIKRTLKRIIKEVIKTNFFSFLTAFRGRPRTTEWIPSHGVPWKLYHENDDSLSRF